jgi:hypothetical protein
MKIIRGLFNINNLEGLCGGFISEILQACAMIDELMSYDACAF